MSKRLVFGQSPIETMRVRCQDCDDEGRDWTADGEYCDVCNGRGYLEYEWNFVTGEQLEE